MKKVFLLLAAVIVSVSAVNAQYAFNRGDLVFNAMIGIGNNLYSGSNYKTTVIPLAVSGEYGVVDDLFNNGNGAIGVGGILGVSGGKVRRYDQFAGEFGVKSTSVVLAARGVFHYEFVDRLDTYAALTLGVDIVNSRAYGTHTGPALSLDSSGFMAGFCVGARYYFTDSFAVAAELGYGLATLSLGVAYKF